MWFVLYDALFAIICWASFEYGLPLSAFAAARRLHPRHRFGRAGFFYARDADGLNQKIFYFHVGIAITAYACFGWEAEGLRVLWKRDENVGSGAMSRFTRASSSARLLVTG